MPKGVQNIVEYRGQPMSLSEFADAVGLSRKTVQSRWERGERDIERLSRVPDKRYAHQKPKADDICRNSLLAGWKSIPIASETATTPSPKSESAMTSGSTSYGV